MKNDDGHEIGSWNVMRPSQHGEEPKVFSAGFQTHDSAARWIDENPEVHAFLPYCEEVV